MGQRRLALEIYCSECEQSIVYEGESPRFCQHCGKEFSLAAASPETDSPGADATIAPMNAPFVPVKPSGEGDVVGPYRLVRWLGSGGMGTVWEAVETQTGRRVALKRLFDNMAADETYVKRFVREAQLAAQISHPKVTFIFDSGNEGGQPYIAMELMPGRTLDDRVEDEGPLSVSNAVDSILDVVEGLIAAHKLGVIHRDVKPANCFIAADDSVKIGDFGLSKSLLNNDVDLTQTGTFMGTPSYAAPEQIRAGELDGRTDVYSAGATLYFLLTARTPFKGDAMSVTAQIITDKPRSTRQFNTDIPKDLDGVIAKCLEKDPVNRFYDLEQLKVALLPYASKQESIADLGRRLAAFMIDQSMIQILFNLFTTIWVLGATYYSQTVLGLETDKSFLALFREGIVSILFWKGILAWSGTVLYYTVFEGRFGRGIGKRLMGLQVVNREGQRAGMGRTLLRAVAVPGCFAIPLVVVFWYAKQGEMPFASADYFIFLLVRTIAYGVPILVCISTMRTSNRLLGVQGMISGTRVIRINTGRQKTDVTVVQPQLKTTDPVCLGPYTTRDLISTSGLNRVFLGHDEQLNRDVWIVEGDSNSKPSDRRIHLARVSRQRWLEGGELENGKRWDAFEAIHGTPIETFVGTQCQADWSLYGQVMTEMIDELQQSIVDGTLPESLSLTQVWLDQDGHAKLIDKLMIQPASPSEESAIRESKIRENKPPLPSKSGPVEKAVGLVQELGNLLHRTQVLPSSIQDFLIQLKTQPKTESTLEWANEELKILAKPIGSIRWDTRLGILSATFGIELLVYALIVGCLFLSLYYLIPIPITMQLLVGMTGGLGLPVVFGSWFRGGVVFHVMGIQVCDSDGSPASRIKCAIRSGISWLPAIALIGVIILSTLDSEQNFGPERLGIESVKLETLSNEVWLVVSPMVTLVSAILLVIGLVFSVLSPKIGLVDYLLGTRLMPK